jgi:hypothetical protein
VTWLLSLPEIAEQVDKTEATARVWLHRHCIKAAQRVHVERGPHRALYDGDQVKRHAANEEPTCPGCVAARKGTTRRPIR